MDEILDMAMEEGDEDMYGEDEIDFSAVTGPVVYTRSHIIGTPEGREFYGLARVHNFACSWPCVYRRAREQGAVCGVRVGE